MNTSYAILGIGLILSLAIAATGMTILSALTAIVGLIAGLWLKGNNVKFFLGVLVLGGFSSVLALTPIGAIAGEWFGKFITTLFTALASFFFALAAIPALRIVFGARIKV